MLKTGVLGGIVSIFIAIISYVGISLIYSLLSDPDPGSGMLTAGIVIILIPIIGSLSFVGILVVAQIQNYLKNRKELK